MKTKLIFPVFIGFVLTGALLPASAGDTSPAPFPGDASTFQNVTNIVFRQFTKLETNKLGQEIPKWKQFAVSDPKEIRRLVASLHLVVPETVAPSDEHLDEALFEKSSGEVRVSFCHICFNIIESERPYKHRHYTMPKQFFDEFQRLARQRGWQVERE